jgi:hypothetical protein
MGDDNTDKTLTFTNEGTFLHWLKSQKKTTFSVPVKLDGSMYSFQYIRVTKQALSDFRISRDEAIEVSISKGNFSDRYYAFIKPMRIEGDNK